MRITTNEKYSCSALLGIAPVPLCRIYSRMRNELTIRVCSSDHSWSFLVILAMTMTMTINSNSVLLVRVTCKVGMKVLNMFKKFVYPAVPSTNTFHSWLCALKMCSYLLCHTAYVLYSSHSYCIRGCSNCVLCHLYWQWDWGRPEDSAN